MLLVVGGIKGGSGKSTLATNLAVAYASLGRKTLLIDGDDQGSTSDWAEQRSQCENIKYDFPTIRLLGKSIHTQIAKMKEDFQIVIVDTGGRDTTTQRSALTIADMYLIPFKPRSFDVWTLGKVKGLVSEVKSINPKLKTLVCINQADFKGTDNEVAKEIIKDEFLLDDFLLCDLFIGNRKAFSNASAEGMSVIEILKDLKATEELWQLLNYIENFNTY